MTNVFRPVLVALGVMAFAPLAQAEKATGNPMRYFRAEDAVAYSNCVHSITNVQQGGELYGMTWAAEADYHVDRVVAAGCTDGMAAMKFLCTNILDNAPQPTVAGFPGCTAFMVTNSAGEHLVGRNLDYMLPMAHVLLFVPKNPALNRKYSSIGTVDAGWLGYEGGHLDDGKTDLSYAALFPYYCMDGMNEKGVMVTILALDARTRPSTGAKDWMTEQFYSNRTNVVLSIAIRYLLDNAGTAAEGVQLMENFNVFAALGGDLGIAGNYHLYICDPSGDTRTVEWMPPAAEGESWQLREVKGATAISNFHLTDGYGHGSNRWEIARHAIACCDGHLESPDAMNLCRAVAQRKGTDLTSTTHWSVLYNLDTLSADIATFCHYDEIFPYWFKSGDDVWEIGAAKSVKPSVETELPAYDAASAEAGKVYRLAISSIDDEPCYAWRPSETGACVCAVNRMGCTYDAAHEPVHVAVTFDGAWPNKAVCYADMSGMDAFRPESVVAGVNGRGVSARLARFRQTGAAGAVPASRALCTALLTCGSGNAVDVAESLKGSLPAVPGTGVIFTDAAGNVAVWPEGCETVTDDASEMVRYSLDLRQGVYEIDGEGRGQFDELPGLMRLASCADTKAVVSMGYGHLDVMLPNSNVLWRAELVGADIPAYGVIAEPKAVSHATATLAYASGQAVATNNQGRLVAGTDATLKVVYTADPGYRFADGAKSWAREFSVGDAVTTPPAPGAAPFRMPDYAEETGRDWLFNHAIAGRECPDESAADSGVDLFYVYPTLAGGEQIVVDGFRGIDDATMRSAATNFQTAVGAYVGSGRCFADMTHVYAPFYRQATLATATDCATNAAGQIVADANAKYLAKLCEGPAYSDVTNALTTYFAKWNNGRKLVFAAHSQGSALLRLVMENYFTLPENRDKAKQIICSYQIGYGVSEGKMSDITAKTGIAFASDATGTNVIVSYNTMSAVTAGNSILLPPDTIAINPIAWTRNTALAEKGLNLGALTNRLGTADVIVPGLYGAQVADTGANRGEVVVCAELKGSEMGEELFGKGSLHGSDYGAFWEDLHKNCYDRITAATGKAPVVGRPADYGDKGRWMRYGDRDNTGSTAKPFDVFYLYPTSTGSSEYVAPVDDDMKERALGNYRQSVEPLESYANVYAPYYRQISATGIMADPTVEGLQLNLARHVGKTDVFAALDHYFTTVNPGGTVRPFVLASHSQGSASLKNAFEQYFTGEKKAYLEKMVAAYTIGYTFPTDWCAKYGVTFATGAADTGVLLTWNAEGPDAPALANMLTKDPNGQAINPLNWRRDDTYAPVAENLGSFRDGEPVAGVTDALLQPAVRPGAVVVSNATGYAYAPAVLFGAESYHFDDWGMFRENACANVLDRGKDLTGYAKLCATNWPKHVTGTVRAAGEEKRAVGGMYWAVTNASSVTAEFRPGHGYRLLDGGVEVAAKEVAFALVAGEWYAAEASALSCQNRQRKPDYTQAKDWLLNHCLKPDEARDVAGEPSQDPGVDLVYVYGTVAMTNAETTVDGFADLDDPQMRGDEATHTGGAWGMIPGSVKAFSDYTRVYMPFYRQMTLCGATNVMAGVGMAGANQAFADALKGGAAYEDIAAALDAYFANWNKGRPFILAGCSQGAAMLRNMVQHYFTQPGNKGKLDRLVACYGIAYGVTKDWAANVEAATDGRIHFATNATERGVYVSWNTVGPDSQNIPNGLVPPNAISVNPLSWTTEATPAEADRNYGALTNAATGAIVAHLYDATVDTVKGVVVSTNLPASDYIQGLEWFGDKSLHGWEISAWWENLRDNAYARIETATGKRPRCGTPNDYAKDGNWMVKPETADKPVDVFFLYPTTDAGGTPNLVAEIDGAMKATAWDAYQQDTMGFWSYANMYAPYYRQASFLGLQAQSGVSGLKNFCSTHVVKTDVFAALDYYFTNLNASAKRPYILVGHSQGSCNIKLVFEEYMKDHADYKAKLVAAYAMGFAVEKSWCEKAGVDFAEGETDTGVILTWNCEGPDATHGPVNFLTEPDDGQAINPLNWKTDDTYAPIELNLGSVVTNAAGEYVWGEGNADARLSPKGGSAYGFRPGALVVTNTTAAYSPAVLGYQSFHGSDGAFFQRNVGNNGFTRYAAFAGLKPVDETGIPTVADATWKIESSSDGATWEEALKSPVDGKYYIAGTPPSASARVTYTVNPEKAAAGFVFVNGKTTVSFVLTYADGKWVQTEDEEDIRAGTKVIYNQRKPDYAAADGHDWLFHHDIAAKRYEGEPAEDPGVDLFYFYPTSVLVSDDHCVDGICDLDDPYLRGPAGATSSWNMTAKVFGDFTHVYAPYYRQTPVDVEMSFPKDGTGYDKITRYWYERAPYADVTNALTHYFTKINPNGERPFVFAGHSHGAGMLILAMERFFRDHPQWLDKMVACYAIGMGVSDRWEESVKAATGVTIATNATDAGVYVFWNTEGPGTSEKMISGLWPTNHVAGVNPITWTRTGEYAPASLNLGGFTADDSGAVRPGLYDASNNVAHGTVVCSSPDLAAQYMDASWGFGEKSLHGWDYKIYWENIRANALQRIKTMNARLGKPDYARIPLAGTPIDYGDDDNWVVASGTDKDLDVFYVYPTTMLTGDSTVVPVTDAMKETAYEKAYVGAASAFAGYANVFMPAYRQMNMAAVTAAQALYTEPRDFIDSLKGQVSRTDLFAALDHYFAHVNANAERPFVLAGHSQGSAMLKQAFEDYFRSTDARRGYLKRMVAAYALGYSFSQEWCDGYGIPFATGETDAGVLVGWNTEGPDARGRSFVIEDGALVINPMNWTRTADVWSGTTPDAMIQERTATNYDYAVGTCALVTTNSTAYLDPSMGFGEKSLHGEDWSLWYDQIAVNAIKRHETLSGPAFGFSETACGVTEGGSVRVYVTGGSTDCVSQVKVTYQKGTGAYKAAYCGGVKVSFPLTLVWEKGEVGAKEILFQTSASSRVEADKAFTLQLSAPVGLRVSAAASVVTVTIRDGAGLVEAPRYVRALAWPADGGTVSGSGTLVNEGSTRTLRATAKNGSTFVGWFRALAADSAIVDLGRPVEPVSERQPTQVKVGYGDAGTYYAVFEDVPAVARVVEPRPFDGGGARAEGVAGVTGWDPAAGTYRTLVGVKFALPVAMEAEEGTRARLTVSDLPTGLSYKSKTGRIEGIPTLAGEYDVEITASNVAGSQTVVYTFEVGELPAGAVGTFAGMVRDDPPGAPSRPGCGTVQFTAGATGSLSAKVVRRQAGSRSFSVRGYDVIDAETLGVAMTNSQKEVFEARLDLSAGEATVLTGTAFGGTRKGTLGWYGEDDGTFAAVRNVFEGTGGAAQQALAAYVGDYASVLWSTNGLGEAETAVGTVSYRVKAKGSVYVKAKIDAAYDGRKKSPAKTLTGTATGAFRYDAETDGGGCEVGLRSGAYLWSTDASFDFGTRDVSGAARYVRPNAEDAAETVDLDELVGDGADD